MIEYSQGLASQVDVAAVCAVAHRALVDNPLFPVAGVRVRAYTPDHYIVADDDERNEFMALTLSVGAGRSKEDLRAAGDAVFRAVKEALSGPLSGEHFALSLNILELVPELSWKENPMHGRLKGGTSVKGEGSA